MPTHYMVSITKTFSFKSSDAETFVKVQKILDKKQQSRGMSKLVMKLLKEYVKNNESPKNKKNSKPTNFLTKDNFKQKCPPFFSPDSVWNEYQGRLEEKEHYDFEIHLQKILDIPNHPANSESLPNQESTNTENQCPPFFSPENLWIEYKKYLKLDKLTAFESQLQKILEQSSIRSHEISTELGVIDN